MSIFYVKPSLLKITFFFGVLILISYMALIIMGDNGFHDLNAMKQEVIDLKAQNDVLQQKNIELYRKIKRLKEDPEFIENVARQELKMITSDEIVFKFTDKEDDVVKTQNPTAKEQKGNNQ